MLFFNASRLQTQKMAQLSAVLSAPLHRRELSCELIKQVFSQMTVFKMKVVHILLREDKKKGICYERGKKRALNEATFFLTGDCVCIMMFFVCGGES